LARLTIRVTRSIDSLDHVPSKTRTKLIALQRYNMTSLPNLNNLRAIDLHPKIGNEFLRNGQKDLPIALIDF